ncbi:MAG: DUF362 domain-containing protein [Bacteroidales bacterium]|nr:DUF362 domain-containing protein [Bacteroidales bacterium]MCF8403179.1 DUF362 domain-containing protein [Bacteroidales bacterium]
MKRREFIRTSGVAASAAVVFGNLNTLFADPNGNPFLPYDLVAVRNGEPDAMFDMAIQSLGGMESFVKAGQKVVVKPNIGWDVSPERAGNTNPILIKRIVEHCYNAGAKEVYVFDNTCDDWNKCYQSSMIEEMAKDAGAKVVPGNSEKYYREVDIPGGVRLKSAKVHELILDSDVFINVPVLKHHSSADLSIAMKNLMGVVWDRMWWHRNDLHQCIADYCTHRKPDLNVIDAYRVMMKNGPRGVSVNDVVSYKTMLVSTDIVAADAAAAKVFGSDPEDIAYIVKAAELGIGNYNLEELNINRIKM